MVGQVPVHLICTQNLTVASVSVALMPHVQECVEGVHFVQQSGHVDPIWCIRIRPLDEALDVLYAFCRESILSADPWQCCTCIGIVSA